LERAGESPRLTPGTVGNLRPWRLHPLLLFQRQNMPPRRISTRLESTS
jgi:hypothetical protein